MTFWLFFFVPIENHKNYFTFRMDFFTCHRSYRKNRKKRPTALAVCQPLPNKVPHKVQDKVQDKFPEVSQSTWDVLAIIQQNPKVTVTDICAKKGLKERQVYKHISLWKSLGLIVRVGSNKTGYWKVTIDYL